MLLIVVLFLLLTLSSGATQQMICAYCKKVIDSGEYIKVENNYYHKNHFLCAYCGHPISDARYFISDGRYYDSSCYFNAVLPKCAYCNQPIESSYIESEGRIYHKDCYDSHIALRCSICGEIISGSYLIDAWGNKYHAEHENNNLQCRYCGRLISGQTSDGGESYSDGRTVCGICRQTAIDDLGDAKDIMAEVADRLAVYGINVDVRKIKISLVDSRQMGQINTDIGEDAEGTTRFEQESYYFGLFKDKRLKIYILNGMPRENFIAVAAHEIMHAWLYQNAPLEMDRAMCEGSCSYASCLALSNDTSPEADFIRRRFEEEKHPVYGEGFRRVKTWVDSIDVPTWLQYLKDNTQPPW